MLTQKKQKIQNFSMHSKVLRTFLDLRKLNFYLILVRQARSDYCDVATIAFPPYLRQS